jgi:hypothetical protein
VSEKIVELQDVVDESRGLYNDFIAPGKKASDSAFVTLNDQRPANSRAHAVIVTDLVIVGMSTRPNIKAAADRAAEIMLKRMFAFLTIVPCNFKYSTCSRTVARRARCRAGLACQRGLQRDV